MELASCGRRRSGERQLPPGEANTTLFYLLLKEKKVKRGLFSVQRETSLTRSLKHGSLENLRMTQNDGRYLIFFFFFFFPLVKVNGSRKMTSCETKVLCNHRAVIRDLIRYSDVTALPAVSRQHISPSATKLPRMSP